MTRGKRSLRGWFAAGMFAAFGIAAACGSDAATGGGGGDGGKDADANEGGDADDADEAGDDATTRDANDDDAREDANDDAGDAQVPGADGSVPARRSFPAVPFHGATMTSPRLVTIVASNDAPSKDGTDVTAAFYGFADAFPATNAWAAVADAYGLGTLTSVKHVTGPAITGAKSYAEFKAYIEALVTGGTAPSPDGNTIYVLIVPTAASIGDHPGACGYHGAYAFDGTNNQIAMIERCGTENDETVLGKMTSIVSHEIVESASDPVVVTTEADGGLTGAFVGYAYPSSYDGLTKKTPWTGPVWAAWAQVVVEVGDLCQGTQTFESPAGSPDGGWEMQRFWSNKAAAAGDPPCVPAPPGAYESVAVPDDWYPVAAGGTVTIPIGGWSTAASPDWALAAHVENTNDPTVLDEITHDALSSALGPSTCATAPAMNAGAGATLTLHMPANAAHGDFAVLRVDSFFATSACAIPGPDDFYHYWPVGVYVP